MFCTCRFFCTKWGISEVVLFAFMALQTKLAVAGIVHQILLVGRVGIVTAHTIERGTVPRIDEPLAEGMAYGMLPGVTALAKLDYIGFQ